MMRSSAGQNVAASIPVPGSASSTTKSCRILATFRPATDTRSTSDIRTVPQVSRLRRKFRAAGTISDRIGNSTGLLRTIIAAAQFNRPRDLATIPLADQSATARATAIGASGGTYLDRKKAVV